MLDQTASGNMVVHKRMTKSSSITGQPSDSRHTHTPWKVLEILNSIVWVEVAVF